MSLRRSHRSSLVPQCLRKLWKKNIEGFYNKFRDFTDNYKHSVSAVCHPVFLVANFNTYERERDTYVWDCLAIDNELTITAFVVLSIHKKKVSMASGKTDFSMHYLELTPEPIRFDPVSSVTNVFFDDAKQEVCED